VCSGHHEIVWAVAFHRAADGRPLIATTGWDGSVRLWDAATGTSLWAAESPNPALSVFSVAMDAGLLATGSPDRRTLGWDLATGGHLYAITGEAPILSVAWGAGLLATGGADCQIKVNDRATGTALRELTGHTGPVSSLAFAGGTLLASGSADLTVRVWDV